METEATGVRGFIMGSSFVSQLVLVFVLLLVLQLVLVFIDKISQIWTRMDQQSVVLFNSTTATAVDIPQGPDSGYPLLHRSRDEKQGSTFSYSAYIFINPETFEVQKPNVDQNVQQVKKLKHVFHKGSEQAFPNLSPAVFVESDTNTLRIYMNTINEWNNYVTIPNIPVGKWFHLVVILKGKNLDVYVNGNVSVRMKLATAPKLSNGGLYVMKPIYFPDRAGYDKSLFADYHIDGAMKGMVSRLKYYAYALNYSEIDSLYREGPNSNSILQPSSNRANPNQQVPPYLYDNWWTNRY
jgi:hypothetical protein